jgi:F0F1-type ATP synthase membrane subunit b/b'
MAEEKNLWSGDVKTHWHPPEGFFEQPAQKIAEGLKSASDGLAQAMDRLDFYINRAGTNLSADAKTRLEKAKEILHGLYS